MSRSSIKIIILILLLLMGGGLIAFKVYRSKTDRIYSNLQEAQANAFFVRRLVIHVNQLEPNALLGFKNLEHLSLSLIDSTENKELWANLRLPAGIKFLRLEQVPEPMIPALLGQVSQLETLKLTCESANYNSRNNVHSVFPLNKLKALRELRWGLCSYESLAVEDGEVSRLESFEIISLHFKRLPTNILSLRNLKRLDIHSNAFKELPSGFHKLKGLEEVRLKFTRIKKNLGELRRLPELEKLTLFGSVAGRKEVVSLDIRPGDFPVLKKLKVVFYKLSKLKGLEGLRNLKDLEFSHVSISDSQVNWSFPPGLQRLELSGMGLRNAPSEIGTLTELRYLDLSSNCLTDLPSEFSRLKKLTWVTVSDNGIRAYPKSLMKSPELHYYNVPISEYYANNCRK